MIFDCSSSPFRGRILPYEQKRYRYLSPSLVAACITGGTIHVSIFQSRRKALWCFQDVFRLNSLDKESLMNHPQTILTGDRPTGQLHLGHYTSARYASASRCSTTTSSLS